MALLSNSRSETTQGNNIRLEMGFVGFVSSIGLSLSLSAPALALEPSVDTDIESNDRLTRLQSLQVGARRAQRDRRQQAQLDAVRSVVHTEQEHSEQEHPEPLQASPLNHSAEDGIYL